MRSSIARSAFLVMGASAFSAVIGFVREIVTAHVFGTKPELDAFLNASTIPVVLFGSFNGALVAALVPVFSDYISTAKYDDVRTLASTVINSLFLILSLATVIAWIFAPLIVPITARGFPPHEQLLETQIVRWLMPSIIATGVSGVCTGLLNANHRFLASALVWVSANVITVTCVLFFHESLGIYSLVLGSTLGIFSQVLIQMPSVISSGFYGLIINIRHPGLGKIGPLLIPVIIGSGATQANIAFDRYFASTLSSGTTSAINYTTKLSYLPIQIIAIAIGTVTFPAIARFFSTSDHKSVRNNVAMSLRMVSFIVLPCAVGLSTLAFPIVQALFQRGAFGPPATALCASLVPFACVPLVATSYSSVLSRACYACKEVRLAVLGSIMTVAINVAISAALIHTLGGRGLLLANGCAGIFLSVYLLLVLQKLVGSLEWNALGSALIRIGASSALMAAALRIGYYLGLYTGTDTAARVIHLGVLLTLAAVVYLAAAWLFRLDELTRLITIVKRRVAPTSSAPSLGS